MMVEDPGSLVSPAVVLTAMVIIVIIHREGSHAATVMSQTGIIGVEVEVQQDAGEIRIGLVHVFAVKGSCWKSWSVQQTIETGAIRLHHVGAPGVQTKRTVIEKESDLKGDCLRNHQLTLPLT